MATIYEIAEKAGVSPKTAARILAGESKRSKHHERVLEWARRLGYVRNVSAANLRSKRTQLVGLLVPFVDNPYYTQVIQAFHDTLGDRGFRVLLACSFGQSDEILSALDLFRSYGVDGILVNGSEGELPAEATRRLQQFRDEKRAVILIGRNSEEHALDQADVANAAGIAAMVDHLVERGHQRIGFIGGSPSNGANQARHEGYLRGLANHRLEARDEWASSGTATPEDAGRRALGVLAGDPRPTALVCGNDLMALGVLKACREAGMEVPGELAVTGFDDIAAASLVVPGLTTMRQPYGQLARACTELLEGRIHAESPDPPTRLLLDTRLVVRGST